MRERRRNLPHLEQDGATYFVTFRLADAIPVERLAELESERTAWLKQNPEPWSDEQQRQYDERFSGKNR